ncbi:hypothetical protein ACJJTC_019145 [Scirpophaga incertulas]
MVLLLCKKWIEVYPHTLALWYPGGDIKSYEWHNKICIFFFHLIPAYLIDGLLFLLGKKTFMVNVQKRISHGLKVLQSYTVKQWRFKNDNFRNLRKKISKEDNEIFFTDLSAIDTDEYMKNYVIGTRTYCCKEDISTLPRARKLNKIRYIVHVTCQILFYLILVWLIYSYRHVFTSSVEFLDSTLKSLPPISNVKAEEPDFINS